jgi:type VI secretion system protein ImpK
MQPAPVQQSDSLAVLFQELLTVIVRLRSNRQPVSDAESFRAQIRSGLASVEQEALRRGYNGEDVRVAIFAIVAFLDESILNSGNPLFADWPRKPLQEELFGVHVAGEIFFRNIDRLLARPDSGHLEELLEIYQLCLLLGFRGRYTSAGGGDLRTLAASIAEKRRRIRPRRTTISPHWAPAEEAAAAVPDAWLNRLLWSAVGSAGLAIVLFLIYLLLLTSSGSELQDVLAQRKL